MARAIAGISSSTAALPHNPLGALAQRFAGFLRVMTHVAHHYHPERHYMRGPGPAWQAKHGAQHDQKPA